MSIIAQVKSAIRTIELIDPINLELGIQTMSTRYCPTLGCCVYNKPEVSMLRMPVEVYSLSFKCIGYFPPVAIAYHYTQLCN